MGMAFNKFFTRGTFRLGEAFVDPPVVNSISAARTKNANIQYTTLNAQLWSTLLKFVYRST